MSDKKEEDRLGRNRIPVLSYDVYHWPEFKAFAERLGLQYYLPSRSVRISMPFDGEVTIDHEYLAMEPEEGIADTTTQHNKEFRTFIPAGT